MLKSLGEDQNTTTLHPFGNMKDKPEQLPGPQDRFPGWGQCQAEDKHWASWPSRLPELAGECSKDVQKMGSRSSERFSQEDSERGKEDKDPLRDPGQDLNRVPEDPCRSSRNISVNTQVDQEGADSDFVRLQRCKSGNYLPRSPEQQRVDNTVKSHLDQMLGETSKGMVPMHAHQSWLTASHAVPKSDTQTKSRDQALSSGQKCHVNNSQGLFFLDPCIQQVLEITYDKVSVRHRWGSTLQFLEPITLKSQPPPLTPSTIPSLDFSDCGDKSTGKFANYLGDILEKV
ncbi:spermatogenesis-associated protein 31E1-like [Nycticebus coucang]|uniref:spermatogenesis-associated protein 31E1-like n=1 Tax=Nycticebus coucang TaxID=9470 RepID=UPI00234C6D1C|nr:spermatogenesis-associated protein 31E1-like [Nycticebus coucang]